MSLVPATIRINDRCAEAINCELCICRATETATILRAKRWKSGLPVERVNDRSPLRSNRNLNAIYKRKRNMSLSCVVYLKVYNKESLTGGLKTREKCF